MTGLPAALWRTDRADVAYVIEVRELCRLGQRPDLAIGLIESKMPVEAVRDLMIELVFGYRSPFRKGIATAPFPNLYRGQEFGGPDPHAINPDD